MIVSRKVCNGLLREGVLALIDLDDKQSKSAMQVENLLQAVQVPFLNAYGPKRILNYSNSFSVNLHPQWDQLSKALMDLVAHFKWPSFVYVYERFSGWRAGCKNVSASVPRRNLFFIQLTDLGRLTPLVVQYTNLQNMVLHQLPEVKTDW